MPNKNYIKGRALEYEVMGILRKEGWQVARTAGSHSPWDVIAVSHELKLWMTPLYAAGFDIDGNYIRVGVRTTRKYTDRIYIEAIPSTDQTTVVLFIQCKRKKK